MAIVFYALLALIVFTAIPFGTVEPWWQGLFHALVFALAALSLTEKLFRNNTRGAQNHPRLPLTLLYPLLALIAFAFVQTVPLLSSASLTGRTTLSADVFQTREFILHLLALLLLGWMLLTHTVTHKRFRVLCDVVIAVGVFSALFGLLRQALQRAPNFILPHLLPGYGYAQFINPNHFAFLIELSLGLVLGLLVFQGATGKRRALYLLAALPMWVALVLANSRGGIVSMLCQVLFLAALRISQPKEKTRAQSRPRRFLLSAMLLAILLLGAVVTVVFVGGDPLTGKMGSLSVELDRQKADTFSLRPNIWRATWQLVKEHPIAGVGLGGYWIAITKYHEGSGEATPQEAHNDYLELLASGGIIGVAIGIWFVIAFVRTVQQKLNYFRALPALDRDTTFARAATLGAIAGILTVAIHSIVDFGLHITVVAVVFTALVAVICVEPGLGD